MSYQYLFCPACAMQRTGHGYRCSVCNSVLRRTESHEVTAPHALRPIVRAARISQQPSRQPVAA